MPPLEAEAAASPPPSRGRDRVGGNSDGSGIPPPLTPPHKGEGNRSQRAAIGERDPNGPIWQWDAFHADAWKPPAGDAELPEGPVIVSKKMWLAERDRLINRNEPLGLRIEPGETVDDFAGDLGRFALIALSFPNFSDGRAFSTARLLREKYGFAGELRAVGNILSDQIPFMRRVGFDSYEVTHAPTRRVLAEGRIVEVDLSYQPGERWIGRSLKK